MNHNILVALEDLEYPHFQDDLEARVVLVILWSLVDLFWILPVDQVVLANLVVLEIQSLFHLSLQAFLFHQVVLGPQEVLGILVSLQVQALLLSQQLLEDQVVLVALAGCDLNNNRSGFDSTFD